ncbi:MAG: alpha/beta hydrolase [Planctomycetales bacterium]|nr:alpha/beta hydrolase [Planctomycetales bacterium]
MTFSHREFVRCSISTALLFILLCPAQAQTTDGVARKGANPSRSYPPQIADANQEIYKKIGDVELKAYVFNPDDWKPGDKRPAIIFFFGGGWRSGSPTQFEHHCRYFAARGMVAITADYRVASRQDVRAVACVADAKSAIRWLRNNAERLGVDPAKVVAAGGSAGGHIAAATGTIKGFDESDEDSSISSIPNAMALFNPALVLAPVEGLAGFDAKKLQELEPRLGVPPAALSPYHCLTEKIAPTIIFHGEADTTVPFKTAELFTERAQQLGSHCELKGYAGQPHGFFNRSRGNENYFKQTVMELDRFLVELNYLPSAADSSALELLAP